MIFEHKLFDSFKKVNYLFKYRRNLSNNYPELNVNYLCNPVNLRFIEKNIANRKGIGNIKLVNELKTQLDRINENDSQFQAIRHDFHNELLKIPNNTHPDIENLGDQPKLIKLVNEKRSFDFKPFDFHEITKRLRLVRTDKLGQVCGSRGYFLLGDLAELETALINYFLAKLKEQQFDLISVPDLLHRSTIESCGMNTRGERNQVYSIDCDEYKGDLCLSGTSEMALAGYFADTMLSEDDLPLKLSAVSRCFRAETSSVAEERGIFRVHEFTKVEMFVVCMPSQSDAVLEDILRLEEANFCSLDLHFQVLDMPPHDLGAQAYRKYDIEAWMPGRGRYGEISSCSNCTDYQSRRLGIKYRKKNGDIDFVHTLNGTACAIPRLLIALTENGQSSNGTISLPNVLHPFMRGKTFIGKQKLVPDLKLIKTKSF